MNNLVKTVGLSSSFLLNSHNWVPKQTSYDAKLVKFKNRESAENDQLSELSSDVVGIKTVKFAVVPTSKITLSSTDICGIDSDHSDLQDNVALIEVNGKPISNHDYNYLIGQEDENEPFSKLAAKYGLTMRKHGKPARQSMKQIKKTEVDWTEKQIDKYQDAY